MVLFDGSCRYSIINLTIARTLGLIMVTDGGVISLLRKIFGNRGRARFTEGRGPSMIFVLPSLPSTTLTGARVHPEVLYLPLVLVLYSTSTVIFLNAAR